MVSFLLVLTSIFPSALLTVLHVYSLRWLFIALPIYGFLKNFKAVDVVAKILQIRQSRNYRLKEPVGF